MVWRIIFALSIFIATTSAFAGFDEGVTAYKAEDYATAMKEWLPLAKKGNPDAQRNLGIMYQYGEGVKIDLKKAVDWYTKAANQGESSSQAMGSDAVDGNDWACDSRFYSTSNRLLTQRIVFGVLSTRRVQPQSVRCGAG